MTEGKSSGKCMKLVLTLLTLWSIASLITIVVWATAPDFKSASQCRAELKELTVQHEGSKVVCQKNQEALEEMVTKVREEQDALRAELMLMVIKLNATNATLDQCREDNLVLATNISVLQETVETLQQKQANLTTLLAIKEDDIEALVQNLTVLELQTQTCYSLKEAAQAQSSASETQTRACQSQQQYLQRQLSKCKVSDSEAARQTTPEKTSPPGGSAAAPLSLSVVHITVLMSATVLFT